MERGPFEAKAVYRKAMYDPTEIKRKEERVLKKANRLSILMAKENFHATVDIDFTDQYQ